jgi:hypothetical protein
MACCCSSCCLSFASFSSCQSGLKTYWAEAGAAAARAREAARTFKRFRIRGLVEVVVRGRIELPT